MPISSSKRLSPDSHRRSAGSVQTLVLALIAVASVAGLALVMMGGTGNEALKQPSPTAGLANASGDAMRRAEASTRPSTAEGHTRTARAASTESTAPGPLGQPSEVAGSDAALPGTSTSSGRYAEAGAARARAAELEDRRFAQSDRAESASNEAPRGLNTARASDGAQPNSDPSANDMPSTPAEARFGSDIWGRIRSIDGRPIQDFRDISAAYQGKGPNGQFELEYEDANGNVVTEVVPLQFCCNDAPPASR